ncbi:hypothetical protein BC831DRAFT_511471 [Entophlyctis helioformis]|nr:hypothetical protein BC831DRAFT_511471 [Entophlyctis helioformis]
MNEPNGSSGSSTQAAAQAAAAPWTAGAHLQRNDTLRSSSINGSSQASAKTDAVTLPTDSGFAASSVHIQRPPLSVHQHKPLPPPPAHATLHAAAQPLADSAAAASATTTPSAADPRVAPGDGAAFLTDARQPPAAEADAAVHLRRASIESWVESIASSQTSPSASAAASASASNPAKWPLSSAAAGNAPSSPFANAAAGPAAGPRGWLWIATGSSLAVERPSTDDAHSLATIDSAAVSESDVHLQPGMLPARFAHLAALDGHNPDSLHHRHGPGHTRAIQLLGRDLSSLIETPSGGGGASSTGATAATSGHVAIQAATIGLDSDNDDYGSHLYRRASETSLASSIHVFGGLSGLAVGSIGIRGTPGHDSVDTFIILPDDDQDTDSDLEGDLQSDISHMHAQYVPYNAQHRLSPSTSPMSSPRGQPVQPVLARSFFGASLSEPILRSNMSSFGSNPPALVRSNHSSTGVSDVANASSSSLSASSSLQQPVIATRSSFLKVPNTAGMHKSVSFSHLAQVRVYQKTDFEDELHRQQQEEQKERQERFGDAFPVVSVTAVDGQAEHAHKPRADQADSKDKESGAWKMLFGWRLRVYHPSVLATSKLANPETLFMVRLLSLAWSLFTIISTCTAVHAKIVFTDLLMLAWMVWAAYLALAVMRSFLFIRSRRSLAAKLAADESGNVESAAAKVTATSSASVLGPRSPAGRSIHLLAYLIPSVFLVSSGLLIGIALRIPSVSPFTLGVAGRLSTWQSLNLCFAPLALVAIEAALNRLPLFWSQLLAVVTTSLMYIAWVLIAHAVWPSSTLAYPQLDPTASGVWAMQLIVMALPLIVFVALVAAHKGRDLALAGRPTKK